MKILLVEDDAAQVKLLRQLLEKYHIIRTASTLEEAEYHFNLSEYDAFIVDLELPDGSGRDFCRYIRENGSKAGILVLTAALSIDEKMLSFESGIDDYLTKPFHGPELLARLRVLSRRSEYNYMEDTLAVDDLTLNITEKTVWRGERKVFLRPKEFEILGFLIKNRGRVISRSTILDHFWDDTQETLSNIVDVHIKNIRGAVDKPFDRHTIKTIRGFGYKIEK